MLFSSTAVVRGLGHVPDLPDPRDEDFLKLGLGTSTTPLACVDMEQWYLRQDQGPTQSCTGQAARQTVRLWQAANLGAIEVDPSALGCYYNGRVWYPGQKDVDGGAQIRSVFRGINQYGIIEDTDWPFVARKVNVQPGARAELGAYRHRKARFRKIFAGGDLRLDAFRSSIVARCPIELGIPVYASMMPDEGSTHIELPVGDTPVGWHAVSLLGYKVESGRFWGRIGNSWGAWRDNGLAWLSGDFLQHAVDCWSIELISP